MSKQSSAAAVHPPLFDPVNCTTISKKVNRKNKSPGLDLEIHEAGKPPEGLGSSER